MNVKIELVSNADDQGAHIKTTKITEAVKQAKALLQDGGVDFIPGAGGKEQGILAMCKAMGITPEEVIAFGDAENDISMLRLAGIGVAMGNGVPAAKAAADYVTDPIEQDGIWNALVKFGLI